MSKIQKQDVSNISEHLGIILTEEQIQWVLDNYDSYEEQDPTGTWNLIVEQMLYDIPGEDFKFYLDQKATTWMRTNFTLKANSSDEARQLSVDFVRQGRTSSLPWEEIDDTKETMSLEENGGFSTEEIYEDDGIVVYHNGKDIDEERDERISSTLKSEVVSILNTLKKDAELALSGEWDCTTQEGIETGFNGQITLIEDLLYKLRKV
jgi:hypothetical protein